MFRKKTSYYVLNRNLSLKGAIQIKSRLSFYSPGSNVLKNLKTFFLHETLSFLKKCDPQHYKKAWLRGIIRDSILGSVCLENIEQGKRAIWLADLSYWPCRLTKSCDNNIVLNRARGSYWEIWVRGQSKDKGGIFHNKA